MLHKVYASVIAVIVIICLFVGYQWLKSHDAWKDFQKDLAVSQEKEKQNKQNEQKANSTITTATASNVSIDAETKLKLADVQRQLANKPNSDQIQALIKAALPGVNITSETIGGSSKLVIDDTQVNRDIINQADAGFKSCRFNLDDCQRKQTNFKTIVEQKDLIIASMQQTIDIKTKDLKEATRFGKGGNVWSRTGRVALPIASAAAGGALVASQGHSSPKATAIAAGASGGICAFAIRF